MTILFFILCSLPCFGRETVAAGQDGRFVRLKARVVREVKVLSRHTLSGL